MIADEDSPGCVLARETAAASDAPLWGRQGAFEITASGARVRIEMEGLFGIASSSHWLGFAAHAVDWDQPFISATGYRSFLGCSVEIAPGVSPDAFCARTIETRVSREMTGRLVAISKQYRRDRR